MMVTLGREKRGWHKSTLLGKVLKVLQDLSQSVQVTIDDF